MKIKTEDVKEYKDAVLALSEAKCTKLLKQSVIERRLEEILKIVFKNCFDKYPSHYEFCGVTAGQVYFGNPGDFENKKAVIILDNGAEWGLLYSIPEHWLYEDFEDEFYRGLKAYREKVGKETESKEQIAKRAKGKLDQILTKEEIEALGIDP